MEGVSMLKQSMSRDELFPAGSLSSRQWDLPILEPLSAATNIIAFISHDLRHPLTAILANAEFLTRSDISEMEKRDFYREIRCAIHRMNVMVASLLECSKGRETFRPTVGNVVGSVEGASGATSGAQAFRRLTLS